MAKVILKGMNTDVLPVLDFGCYGGKLANLSDDVFDYSAVMVENLDPKDMGQEEYDEAIELVNKEYSGYDEFRQDVLDIAAGYLNDAFSDYGIPGGVIDGTLAWDSPQFYNYRDDRMSFDFEINTDWVAKTFTELSQEQSFIDYLKKRFSSRSGFISFIPDNVDKFNELLNPADEDYWKVVCAIVSYLVDQDPEISEDVEDSMIDDLFGNHTYVSFSELGIF